MQAKLYGKGGKLIERAVDVPDSILCKSQTQKHVREFEEVTHTLELRYDDDCGNGHNSFAVTLSTWSSAGCQHDLVEKVFPEFAYLIPWHLCGSDGPMHYIPNTLYQAGDRDHWGLLAGEPHHFDTRIKFGDFPITYEATKELIEFVDGMSPANLADLEILAVHHKDSTGHVFSPKYTLGGMDAETWHKCPFDTLDEADQFIAAAGSYPIELVKTATSWGEGKAPELESARSCAIWPEAELEDFTESKLLDRLPGLLERFKVDMEALGFTY